MADSEPNDEPVGQPRPSSSFQWVTITDPQQAKDRDTMRNVRVHVMNNYLHKEQRNPHSTDARVHNGSERKREHTASSTPQRQPERRHSTTQDAAVAGPFVWWSTPPASSNGDHTSSVSPREASASTSTTLQCRAPVPPILTNYENASVSRRSSDTLSALVPRRVMRFADHIPYDMAFSRAYGLADPSARLDPFPTESRFVNCEIDVEDLKRNCKSISADSVLFIHLTDAYKAASTLVAKL